MVVQRRARIRIADLVARRFVQGNLVSPDDDRTGQMMWVESCGVLGRGAGKQSAPKNATSSCKTGVKSTRKGRVNIRHILKFNNSTDT